MADGAAAAVKSEMRFAAAADNEVEHLKRENARTYLLAEAIGSTTNATIQEDPAADQKPATD